MPMGLLLLLAAYAVVVWTLIWGYFGIMFVIYMVERIRENRKNKRK